MKDKKALRKYFRVFCVFGIISSWLTIGSIWAGLATVPLVGYCLTAGFFGIAVVADKI